MITPVCPNCRSPLVSGACPSCGFRPDVAAGVARFIARESPTASGQAAYFDMGVDDEFEIERPRGLPVLYGWLLAEKFRRAIGDLPTAGRTALVVCGGSGMDAEFLANAGVDVVSSDISVGASLRAVERARRHDVAIESIVADASQLPFSDRSIDIVYVHDGLHHIEDPFSGLREMARVARHAVCLTEPAHAFVTAVAVKAGIALEREEAGNRVARLSIPDVRAMLEAEGFQIVRAQRYGMFYRHEPGILMRAFSQPVLFPVARSALRLANRLFGRFGNKLSVQAVRR